MTELDKFIYSLQIQIKRGDDFPKFLSNIDLLAPKYIDIFTAANWPAKFAEAFFIKITNFLVSKFQYQNRHENIISSPYSLIIDPSNGCPLHCPGCLHNTTFQNKIRPDWPNGLLNERLYTSFIEKFGPYASSILFFNWGEPLLNRNTPRFIHQAKQFLLHTSLSSNLSIEFDSEALVNSGLDYMILSIDGATPETYNQYRQGGDFDLVLDNVRNMTTAKKKSGRMTPWLCWHFLLFEHNSHEIELAVNMAAELGVDAIKFSTPYDVIWQPDIQPSQNHKENRFAFTNTEKTNINNQTVIAAIFHDLFQEKWSEKLNDIDTNLCTKRSGTTCQWLYSTIVLDALGRYLPCCYVPRKDSGFTYIFGEVTDNNISSQSCFNNKYYRFSRKHFTWLSELKKINGFAPILSDRRRATYCVACPDRERPPLINDNDLKTYVQKLDTTGILSDESIDIISKWNN